MSRFAAPSFTAEPLFLHTRRTSVPVAPCLRPGAQSKPLIAACPWETVDALWSTAVERKEHMNDFRILQADRADIQPFRDGNPTARLLWPIWAIVRWWLVATFPRWSRRPESAQTGESVHAPGTEHRRERLDVRCTTEGTVCPQPPSWYRAADKRGAARGHDDGCLEGTRREKTGGMLRPWSGRGVGIRGKASVRGPGTRRPWK